MEGNEGQSSGIFKSTDIHASKAGAKVEYFKQTKNSSQKKKPSFNIKQLLVKKIHLFGKEIPLIFIIIPAAVIIIAGIIICLISISGANNSNTSTGSSSADAATAESTDAQQDEEPDPNAPKSLDDQASETLKSSGLAAFLSQYQSALDAAQSDEDRANIYLSRSSNLFSHYLESNNEDYKKQAIQDGLTAEKLFATAASANNLATIYYALDDDQAGDFYYRLYEERVAAESPVQSDGEENE